MRKEALERRAPRIEAEIARCLDGIEAKALEVRTQHRFDRVVRSVVGDAIERGTRSLGRFRARI